MIINIDDSEAASLEQIRAILAESGDLRFTGQKRPEVYEWVESTLVRHQYTSLARVGKGVVRQYLARMTGLSRAQTTRLVTSYQETGRVEAVAYQRTKFAAQYTADVELLAYVDKNFSTQTSHTAAGSVTAIRGSHALKAGFDYRAYYNNQLQNSQASGNLSFGVNFTQGPNPNQASAAAGNGLATFLLGIPGGNIVNRPATAFRSAYAAGFLQDDWKVGRNLTLNIGMRYEVNQPRTDRYDRITVFDLSAPSPIASRVPSVPNLKGAMTYRDSGNRRLTDADWNNWGPRIGLAWQASQDREALLAELHTAGGVHMVEEYQRPFLVDSGSHQLEGGACARPCGYTASAGAEPDPGIAVRPGQDAGQAVESRA